MKILILRFSSIGDIVLTTPVIRCLKKQVPGVKIHYATKKAFYSIVQHNPYLDNIHLLDSSLMELIKELRQQRFDYVIDLHHNQRTFLIKLLLGVKCSSFDKLNFEKWLMVNFKIDRLPPVHIVDRYLSTLNELKIVNDKEGLDYFISKEDDVDLAALPSGFQNGYIGWVIGARHNTKKFPLQKIASAIQQLQYPIVLLGGKEDKQAGEQIIASVNCSSALIYNACGKYSLNQSASLVNQTKLIISNDTGLMHIAAAFKKPLISLWGNTIPEFGMYPYFGQHHLSDMRFEVKGLSCRPCSKLGYNQCPLGHFNCMNKLDENSIAQKALVAITTHYNSAPSHE